MSDEMLIHFSSNSSNQSDNSLPNKIAKLEARLVGKGSGPGLGPVSGSSSMPLPAQNVWPSASASSKFDAVDNVPEPSATSSDSDDDDMNNAKTHGLNVVHQ